MSCLCALFGSKLCITFSISFSVNVIFDKDLSVFGCKKVGISLPLSITEHCLAKKRIKQFGFFFEICDKSIFVKNWCNTGYFFITMERL